jgi:methanogenic corrinoid protein MtbC1
MTTAGTTLYHPVSLNREYLAGILLERYAEKHTRTWNNFSMERRVQVREEFLATLGYLEESLATESPAFLIDHACREQSRFDALQFPPGFAVGFFEIFRAVVLQELPPDYRKEGGTFARKALAALKSPPAGCGASVDNGPALSTQAKSFLNYLLAGNPGRAREVIMKALAAGTPLREIYTGFFQPVLWETGRLWERNEVTIAQEHYITGEIRGIMMQLHDRITEAGRAAPRKKTVVTACVGEELHEIGIRMVADFLVMDGWDVYPVGANTPAKSILAAVRERKADVVALSVTMPFRLAELRYLIRSLREGKDTAPVKILVGGHPFAVLPDLGKLVGADAVAMGAEEAVAAADRLIRKPAKKRVTRAGKKK